MEDVIRGLKSAIMAGILSFVIIGGILNIVVFRIYWYNFIDLIGPKMATDIMEIVIMMGILFGTISGIVISLVYQRICRGIPDKRCIAKSFLITLLIWIISGFLPSALYFGFIGYHYLQLQIVLEMVDLIAYLVFWIITIKILIVSRRSNGYSNIEIT